jgi:Transposase DDE domain
MNKKRAEPLTDILTDKTVLGEWFEPMLEILNAGGFSGRPYTSLPMKSFILFGVLRQIQAIKTLREQVQYLMCQHTELTKIPLARSTFSDALGSTARRNILRVLVDQLVKIACKTLPDRLKNIEGLNQRPVIAFDGTYINESSHFYPVVPKDGGRDNKKGHAALVAFDMRRGIPLSTKTEMDSIGEMRVQKNNYDLAIDWSSQKNALYVVDRGFIDGRYWQQRKTDHGATVITRCKSTLIFTELNHRSVSKKMCNGRVLEDIEIALKCADGTTWRLIKWRSPDGDIMEYLTNDLHLEPGVVAFLYYRRWDEEKYFDTFKNDLAGSKAWGKKPAALEQQCLMCMITTILTRMFLQKKAQEMGLAQEDSTQNKRYEKKQEHYVTSKYERTLGVSKQNCKVKVDEEDDERIVFKSYDAYRAFYAIPSKISRQAWRFLKYCCLKISSPDLYVCLLKPMMLAYL